MFLTGYRKKSDYLFLGKFLLLFKAAFLYKNNNQEKENVNKYVLNL